MYSKLFPAEEQLRNEQEAFSSRIISYTSEVMLMEWRFYNAGHAMEKVYFTPNL